jgi:hypothetical protein
MLALKTVPTPVNNDLTFKPFYYYRKLFRDIRNCSGYHSNEKAKANKKFPSRIRRNRTPRWGEQKPPVRRWRPV